MKISSFLKNKITMPKIGKLPEDFDREAYLALNEDVANSGMSPEEHFLLFGHRENRLHSVDSYNNSRIPDDFDDEIYLEIHQDVKLSGQSARDHYVNYGLTEGRPYKYETVDLTELPSDFNEQTYLDLNADVNQFEGSPSYHYLKFGVKEGRKYRKPVIFASFPNANDANIVSSQSIIAIRPKIIAFYLPQYHQIKENDEWWGQGFTEWTNVKKALPNFQGHLQPHIPIGKKYYDLSDGDVQIEQANLAKTFGIDAFCYYMYWFNGRRVLEKPLDQLIENRNIEKEFCVCWANENWTRTWDGNEKDILLQQVHSPESDRQFIKDAIKYLSDPRYLRIDGKLVLLVYRVDLISNCMQTAAIWRDEVRKAGLGELHLCAVQFYGIIDPTPWGFDAAVEFPPHGWLDQRNLADIPANLIKDDFKGHIFEYEKCITHAMSKPYPNYTWYRGVFPGWDNTARRQTTPHIFRGNSPDLFKKWLIEVLRQQIIMAKPEHQIVFINAWNEWGEGAHLEPDEHFGYGNLEAVNAALNEVKGDGEILAVLKRLRQPSDYSTRADDERLLLNSVRGYERTIRYLEKKLHENSLAK